jgi:hypothetical protein
MLIFYNVQTTNSIFVGMNGEVQYIIIALCDFE